jgi:hypothetical protein
MFAPKILLHPQEKYFPMNPLEFILISRFRYERELGKDYGYNKILNDWVETDNKAPEYYDMPLEVLKKFGLNPDKTNRRPKDKNRGKIGNVFLQPDGKPPGNFNPTGNIPCYLYQVDADNGYVFHQYWFFYGYNPSLVGIDLSHQGDWEDYTAVTQDGELVGAILAAHGKRTYYQRDRLEMDGEQIQVYAALGTHALYPQEGSYGKFNTDRARKGGYAWDTSQNVEILAQQGWRDYAGAWGEVGELSATTGPLGAWYKRIPRNFLN